MRQIALKSDCQSCKEVQDQGFSFVIRPAEERRELRQDGGALMGEFSDRSIKKDIVDSFPAPSCSQKGKNGFRIGSQAPQKFLMNAGSYVAAVLS